MYTPEIILSNVLFPAPLKPIIPIFSPCFSIILLFGILFNCVDFGNLDISGLFDEYLNTMNFEDYEIEWMLSLLFIVNKLKITNDDNKNLRRFMQIIFKYKSVIEFEKRFIK